MSIDQKKTCLNCAAMRDFNRVETDEEYNVRGEQIVVQAVMLDVCTICGEARFDEQRDEAILERVYAEYTRRTGVILPCQATLTPNSTH